MARQILHWIARLSSIAAIVPLLMILVGESGTGPSGLRGWIYLALFPVGFSVAYLLAWKYPLVGGSLSLACLVASLVVVGVTFPIAAYLIWGILALPGLLFIIAGIMKQHHRRLAITTPIT